MSDVICTPWDELEGAGAPPPCDAADLPGHTLRSATGTRVKRKASYLIHRPDGRPLAYSCEECRSHFIQAYGGKL